jgi:hypothetical protein
MAGERLKLDFVSRVFEVWTVSTRETILARIALLLTPTVNVSGRVYRSRVEPLARGESPAIVVEPVSDAASQDTLGTLQWTMAVRVAVIVRAPVPDQVADPIVLDIHQRLLADTTLGGYVTDIVPGTTSWEMLEADQPAGVVSIEYTVTYRTALNVLG